MEVLEELKLVVELSEVIDETTDVEVVVLSEVIVDDEET